MGDGQDPGYRIEDQKQKPGRPGDRQLCFGDVAPPPPSPQPPKDQTPGKDGPAQPGKDKAGPPSPVDAGKQPTDTSGKKPETPEEKQKREAAEKAKAEERVKEEARLDALPNNNNTWSQKTYEARVGKAFQPGDKVEAGKDKPQDKDKTVFTYKEKDQAYKAALDHKGPNGEPKPLPVIQVFGSGQTKGTEQFVAENRELSKLLKEVGTGKDAKAIVMFVDVDQVALKNPAAADPKLDPNYDLVNAVNNIDFDHTYDRISARMVTVKAERHGKNVNVVEDQTITMEGRRNKIPETMRTALTQGLDQMKNATPTDQVKVPDKVDVAAERNENLKKTFRTISDEMVKGKEAARGIAADHTKLDDAEKHYHKAILETGKYTIKELNTDIKNLEKEEKQLLEKQAKLKAQAKPEELSAQDKKHLDEVKDMLAVEKSLLRLKRDAHLDWGKVLCQNGHQDVGITWGLGGLRLNQETEAAFPTEKQLTDMGYTKSDLDAMAKLKKAEQPRWEKFENDSPKDLHDRAAKYRQIKAPKWGTEGVAPAPRPDQKPAGGDGKSPVPGGGSTKDRATVDARPFAGEKPDSILPTSFVQLQERQRERDEARRKEDTDKKKSSSEPAEEYLVFTDVYQQLDQPGKEAAIASGRLSELEAIS